MPESGDGTLVVPTSQRSLEDVAGVGAECLGQSCIRSAPNDEAKIEADLVPAAQVNAVDLARAVTNARPADHCARASVQHSSTGFLGNAAHHEPGLPTRGGPGAHHGDASADVAV